MTRMTLAGLVGGLAIGTIVGLAASAVVLIWDAVKHYEED